MCPASDGCETSSVEVANGAILYGEVQNTVGWQLVPDQFGARKYNRDLSTRNRVDGISGYISIVSVLTIPDVYWRIPVYELMLRSRIYMYLSDLPSTNSQYLAHRSQQLS